MDMGSVDLYLNRDVFKAVSLGDAVRKLLDTSAFDIHQASVNFGPMGKFTMKVMHDRKHQCMYVKVWMSQVPINRLLWGIIINEVDWKSQSWYNQIIDGTVNAVKNYI